MAAGEAGRSSPDSWENEEDLSPEKKKSTATLQEGGSQGKGPARDLQRRDRPLRPDPLHPLHPGYTKTPELNHAAYIKNLSSSGNTAYLQHFLPGEGTCPPTPHVQDKGHPDPEGGVTNPGRHPGDLEGESTYARENQGNNTEVPSGEVDDNLSIIFHHRSQGTTSYASLSYWEFYLRCEPLFIGKFLTITQQGIRSYQGGVVERVWRELRRNSLEHEEIPHQFTILPGTLAYPPATTHYPTWNLEPSTTRGTEISTQIQERALER